MSLSLLHITAQHARTPPSTLLFPDSLVKEQTTSLSREVLYAFRGEQIPQLTLEHLIAMWARGTTKPDRLQAGRFQVHEATVPGSIGRTPKPKPPVTARFVLSGLVGCGTFRPPPVTLICQELTVWSTLLRRFSNFFVSSVAAGRVVAGIWRRRTGPSTPARAPVRGPRRSERRPPPLGRRRLP
jgi:hypothetical protein